MKNVLVILRTVAIVVFSLGMIALIYFHIETFLMIWEESYKVYCESPSQIQGVIWERFIIMIPTTIGAVGWLITDSTLRKMEWRIVK